MPINMNKLFELAKNALNNHQIIAFPTETVFGLGIYYDDYQAYLKMNEIKRRNENKPYTLMLSSVEEITKYADVADKYWPIIKKYMPGSLTILVKCKDTIPNFINHGTGIIGIRIPSNKEALDLLKSLEKPLLVPSANKANEKPAMNDLEVKQIFEDEVAVVLPGEAKGGQPSTIIDLTDKKIELVRAGPISLKDIENCLD